MSLENVKGNTETTETNEYEVQNAHSYGGQTCVQTLNKVDQTACNVGLDDNHESFESAKLLGNQGYMSSSDHFVNKTQDQFVQNSTSENPPLENISDHNVTCDEKQVLEMQGNYFSKPESNRKSYSINEFLSIRQTKKKEIEKMFAKNDDRRSDVSEKIFEEYYNEFCKEGQTASSSAKSSVNRNQNNNDNDTNVVATSSDSVGEATVLDADDVSDLESERSRGYRSHMKRRTSSTIRKIQEMIQEEQLKDLRVKNFADGNLSKYQVTKTTALPFKTNYRQRSKSRTKYAKINNDQAYRPFRRWLGVSTCVASDTRFIVHPGKETEQKWRHDKIGYENIAHELTSENDESKRDEETFPCTSGFEKLTQGNEFKIKGSIVFGKEKTVNHYRGFSEFGKNNKDVREVDVATEPIVKLINVGDQNVEKSKCADTGCECTSKQIVNVEGNEGVIHIHQQSHGTVGKMTTKAGSSNRNSSGTTPGLVNNLDEETKSSTTFKSLKRKLKKARKRQYINVQAIKDCEGPFPGQLSFKKGQIIKQMETSQNQPEGMCYGYYKSGKLHRKVRGIYPSSHVTIPADVKPEENIGDVGVTETSEKNVAD